MKRNDVIARARELNEGDVAAEAAFLQALVGESREGPRTLVEMWAMKALPGDRAMGLIPGLEELAVLPLLEALPGAKMDGFNRVWAMRAAVEAHEKMRAVMIGRLMKLLEDVEPLPVVKIPGSEEQPLARRVCDEAYLALRRVMKFEEGRLDGVLEGRAFLEKKPEERDGEIRKLKGTRTFTRFVEDYGT
jgi:hypothetical protein